MRNLLNKYFLVVIFFLLQNYLLAEDNYPSRNFYIDYERNTFIKDSKPFRYVSGSIHSYRIPKELWADRLNKMWASGLNAIEMYIFWNEHELNPGEYDFTGQNDVIAFIKLAEEIGFYIVFRPGPYICAEHDYGGLPWWLLSNGTDSIRPRTNEYNYMKAVKKWFSILLPKIKPHLYKNGGNIITVQIENEYGSYNACDSVYLVNLRDYVISYLGDDIVYFTTDGNKDYFLKCGAIPDVYPTVDFSIWQDIDVSFEVQRKYATKGPLVNSEFYTGWLDHWGEAHNKINTRDFLKPFNKLLVMNANINLYMFHGGTNFGFSNGANEPFIVQPTSYDYDAPLSEAGDVTNKFMAIREEISKHMPIPKVKIPGNSTKLALGRVKMTHHIPLAEAISLFSKKCVDSVKPLSFEKLGQGYGFLLYTTVLQDPNIDGKILSIPGIRDRAYIQIGSRSLGVIYRVNQTSLKINLKDNKDLKLHIIVENMGRLNFGNDMLDSKGILSDVKLDDIILQNWTACLTNDFVPYFQHYGQSSAFNSINEEFLNRNLLTRKNLNEIDFKMPAIYFGEFLPGKGVYDSFLNMEKFTKGVALVYDNKKLTNLGRYWPKVGPQTTLYVPSFFSTYNNRNFVILIEFEGSQCQSIENCYVDFIDYPIIDTAINPI